MKVSRRLIVVAGALALGWGTQAAAQTLEKPKVTVVIAGVSTQMFFVAPLLAYQLGYFKQQGLDITLISAGSGAKALQALVSGGADVVAGAYEHTIQIQPKDIALKAFAMYGQIPGNALAVRAARADRIKSVADLKGKTVGVSAPGSATHLFLNILLAKAGLAPTDVSVIAVGNGSGAIAAMRTGQDLDAISTLDPVITELVTSKDIVIMADSRTLAGTLDVYGGPYASGSLYTKTEFLEKYPKTSQALATAVVKALLWMKNASVDEIIKNLPPENIGGNLDLFRAIVAHNLPNFQHDGKITQAAAENVLRVVAEGDPTFPRASIRLAETYTNEFVERALATLKSH